MILPEDVDIQDILNYYMGKNTPSRQEFIIDNLRVEKDEVEEGSGKAESDETNSEEAAQNEALVAEEA